MPLRRASCPVLFSIHSFTPVLEGVAAALACRRAVGYRRPFAELLLDGLHGAWATSWSATTSPIRARSKATPSMSMARAAALPHALIEIRQDLIARQTGVDEWISAAGASPRTVIE